MTDDPISTGDDLRRDRGPLPQVYGSPEWHRRLSDRVLARAWHGVLLDGDDARRGNARPLSLLPGSLDEPLLLACDAGGRLRCLSNVCTHRGHLLCAAAGAKESIVCPYHGRAFDLAGRCLGMAEFDGVEGFPSRDDDLAEVPLARLGPLAFLSLDPVAAFDAWVAPLRARAEWMDLDALEPDPASIRAYEFDGHWALYCENYLEGLHIPFLHAGLMAAIDFADYRTEIFPWGTLQRATAAPGEPAFDLPQGHPDAGMRVAAWYFWLFPGTMLNLYPWGLSANFVEPLGPARTRVRFQSFVRDASLRERGAGAGLDRIEREDEAAVESVQRGMRSRFARRARYSPSQEAGVHHFHRLLARMLAE